MIGDMKTDKKLVTIFTEFLMKNLQKSQYFTWFYISILFQSA